MATDILVASPAQSLRKLAGDRQVNNPKFGVGLAVLSNLLFGVLYLYSHWLTPLSGTQVFLWRMVAMWVGVALLMVVTNGFLQLSQFLTTLTKKRALLLVLPTPIVASQFWLFMWAPVNGQAINTAMGYFLFPLVMVLMGCAVFKERLNRLQWFAITLAALGVGLQFWMAGSVSWATAWVCLTYPIYYGLRRWQGVPALMGLFVDLTLIAPVAMLVIFYQQQSIATVMGSSLLMVLLVGLGLISALAMQTNLKASSILPMPTFGMLSYLEPALMFVLSVVLLHEPVSQTMVASFGLIWAGVLVMIINSIRASKDNRQSTTDKAQLC